VTGVHGRIDMYLGSCREPRECRTLPNVSPVPSSPVARPKPDPRRNPTSTRQVVVTRSVKAAPSASVDHWSMVLFYAIGVGALALVVFFFLALLGVGLYGQLVWTFTQWDLASVRSAVVKPWAHFTLLMVFLSGTVIGIWFFGGYAWKNLKVRSSNAATRARR
jgi:hypothetical protein